MVSPTNAEEENIFTLATEEHFAKKEKVFRDEIRVMRAFLWVAVLFCMACFFICWYVLSEVSIVTSSLSIFIRQEAVYNEKKELREEMIFQQQISQMKRDSVAWVRHQKQMDRYDALPDYKGE